MEEIKQGIELNQSQIESLHELVEGNPQVFFILVGAMKYNEIKGRYESGSFIDADENSKLSTGTALATGGKDRVIAAAELHKAFPDTLIIPMSRTRDESKPTYAALSNEELIRYGVPESQIYLEEESVSTITEFKEAAKMWKSNNWDNIVFISSEWHIPRSKALFNNIENFADNVEEEEVLTEFAGAIRDGLLTVQFVNSTDVLKIRSQHYHKFFDELADDPSMKQRIVQEQKGIDQINSGTYSGYTLSKKIFD